MDPNATMREIIELRGEMRTELASAHGPDSAVLHDIEQDIRERTDTLREWRRKGGFAPRDGWPHGV